MKTVKDIVYKTVGYGVIATIPAGTTVFRAKNIPSDSNTKWYFSKGWRGMTKEQRSWRRNYGFLLTYNEVKGLEP